MSSFQKWKLVVLSTSNWTSVLQLEFQLSSRRREAASNNQGKGQKTVTLAMKLSFQSAYYGVSSWPARNIPIAPIQWLCLSVTLFDFLHSDAGLMVVLCPEYKENTAAVVEGMVNQLAIGQGSFVICDLWFTHYTDCVILTNGQHQFWWMKMIELVLSSNKAHKVAKCQSPSPVYLGLSLVSCSILFLLFARWSSSPSL